MNLVSSKLQELLTELGLKKNDCSVFVRDNDVSMVKAAGIASIPDLGRIAHTVHLVVLSVLPAKELKLKFTADEVTAVLPKEIVQEVTDEARGQFDSALEDNLIMLSRGQACYIPGERIITKQKW